VQISACPYYTVVTRISEYICSEYPGIIIETITTTTVAIFLYGVECPNSHSPTNWTNWLTG